MARTIADKKSQCLEMARRLIGGGYELDAISLIMDYLEKLDRISLPEDDILDTAGQIYIRIGDLKAAQKLYDFVLSSPTYKSNPRMLIKSFDGLAEIEFMNGKYGNSLKYLKQALNLVSDEKSKLYYYGNVGRINIKLGDYSSAIDTTVRLKQC